MAVVAQGHKGVIVTRWLWVRCTLGGINFYLLYIIFLFLRSRNMAKARRCPESLAESGLRSVLTLGSYVYLVVCGIQREIDKKSRSRRLSHIYFTRSLRKLKISFFNIK